MNPMNTILKLMLVNFYANNFSQLIQRIGFSISASTSFSEQHEHDMNYDCLKILGTRSIALLEHKLSTSEALVSIPIPHTVRHETSPQSSCGNSGICRR